MAYQKYEKQNTKQEQKTSFQDAWTILGSAWDAKSGNGAINIVLNQSVTLKEKDRVQLFRTKNKKTAESPDYVLCQSKEQK